MITEETKLQFYKIFEELGNSLDPTETQINEAKERYKLIGKYLGDPDSPLSEYEPKIKPQGSFALGTMIKPISDDCELDFDLVLQFNVKPKNWTQYDLKKAVGDRLKTSNIYKKMLEVPDNSRCWRIDYAGKTKFHLDILPCLKDLNPTIIEKSGTVTQDDVDKFAVRITDKDNPYYSTESNYKLWPKSNPKGYAEWFKNKMRFRLSEMKKSYLKMAGLEEIPDYMIKTPLQRAVQILKRHRDIMFGNDNDRPISIIITTISAHAYNQEEEVYDALIKILERMEDFIEKRFDLLTGKSISWVPNPVNSEENFADDWESNFRKEKNFKNWINKAKEDISFLSLKSRNENYELLKSAFGARAINEAFRNSGYESILSESKSLPAVLNKSLLKVPHREQPLWPIKIANNVEISARYKHNGNWHSLTTTMSIPKNCELYFIASTNVIKPFEVFWQVVNTGDEARMQNGLRGNIFHSNTAGVGGLKQKEHTKYTGTHWIECFIVKGGVCVARSAEYFINILL